jgi:hypothetical protein
MIKINFNIETIELKLRVPQVGSLKIEFCLLNNAIYFFDDKHYNKTIDYIVNLENEFLLGKGHYKLNNKNNLLKMAGEIKINEFGKIVYLDNNSGHYKPHSQLFNNFFDLFKSNHPTIFDASIKTKAIKHENNFLFE